LGGPIKKERAFFFVNYEGLRQVLGLTRVAQVPDQNARRGLLPCNAVTPLPAGCDPTNPSFVNVGVDPAVKPVLDLFPLPNGSNPGGGIGNYTSTAEQPTNEDFVTGRVDYNFSPSDSFFVRYVSDKSSLTTPYGDGAQSVLPGYGSNYRGWNQYLTIAERKIINPWMINDLRFHAVSTNQSKIPYALGATVPALNFFGADRPAGEVDIGGLSAPGGGWPFLQIQNRFVVDENVYLSRGNHSFEFGVQLSRVQSNNANSIFINGTYAFNDLQDFLTNHAFSVTGALPGFTNSNRRFRELHVYPYIEDNWKVTRNLTLNLGFRYEFMTNPVEANGLTYAVVDPFHDTGFSRVSHVFANNPAIHNFEPRVGFAWSPFGPTTAIRGGFGIFHRLLQARDYSEAYAYAHTYEIGIAFLPPFPNPFAGGRG
jgi:outer membrane receptor protein involved in Fe transport